MKNEQKVRQRKKSANNAVEESKPDSTVDKGKDNGKSKKSGKKSGFQLNFFRIWTRLIVVVAVLIIAYFTQSKDKERKFATRKESIIFRSQNLDCDKDYLDEITEFATCVPNKCGRFVTDSLVNEKEAALLLDLAKRGIEFGQASGGASILDLHSGALSHGESFINIYKLKESKGFLDENVLSAYRVIRRKIAKSISDKFEIDVNSIYLTHPTFFSRINNDTAKTVHDEYWHPHVDKETYSSFHYTSLLYLNDHHRDFQGGRFIFVDENKADNSTMRSIIEPKRGRVSVFTSGAENLHHIEKVTQGTRYAMTISLTCNRKFAIADPAEQNADSVTWNPHKLLAAPQQCSTFLTKHEGILQKTHSANATYPFQKDKFYNTSYDTGDKHIQCGRRADVLKFWFMWRAKGSDGLEKHVDKNFENAEYFTEQIKARADFKMMVEKPEFTNITFWFIPPSLRTIPHDTDEFKQKIHTIAPKIKEQMMKQGNMMITYQPIHDKPNFFRLVLQSSALTKDDMLYFIDEIARLGSDL